MASLSMVFFVLATIIVDRTTGDCPVNCKTGQTCTAVDSGCEECEEAYYGRQCQHRRECRSTVRGREYRGDKSTTASGYTCQRWDAQTPHGHTQPSQPHNFCRNPDNWQEPWCFTLSSIRYERCGIPMCDAQCSAPLLDRPGVDVLNPPSGGFVPGYTVTFGCVTGYELTSGTVTSTCTSGSLTWSSSTLPDCKAVECSVSTIQFPNYGRIQNPKDKYVYQDSLTVVCDTGYDIIGNNVLTCQADKTWAGVLPSCQIKKCTKPQANQHGYIKNPKGEYVYQDEVTFGCNTGYTVTGSEKIQCLADTTWSNNPPTCLINECQNPLLNEKSYITNFKSRYVFGDQIYIVCEYGYTLQGQSTLLCLANKTWDHQPPTCKINECAVPSLNPNSVITNKKTVYYYGDSLDIECNTGYTLQGNSRLDCLGNTNWNNQVPTCKINECPPPQMQPSSKIIINNAKIVYQYQDEITVTCPLGYLPQGENVLQCLANKSWSHPLPTCGAVQCEVPTLSSVISINNQNKGTFAYLDVIQLSCSSGYEFEKGNTSVCEATGTWSEPFPTCQRVRCQDLKLTDNLMISNPNKNGYRYEEHVLLSCKEGYDISSAERLVCQANRQWDRDMPSCTEKPSGIGGLIGGAVGGTVAVIVIIFAVFFVIWRRKHKPKSDTFHDVILKESVSSSAVNKDNSDSVYVNVTDVKVPEGEQSCNIQDDNVYCNMYSNVGDVDKIKVQDLREYVRAKKEIDGFFEGQFKSLPVGLIRETQAARKDVNKTKNKYKNMYPYDDNRVILETIPGCVDSDYVNASKIKGYSGDVKYIASQGPLEKTYVDFWRMLWEQRIGSIIMLTNPFEGGVKKCIQYWPDDGEGHMQCGDIDVELKSSDVFSDFTIRQLKITKNSNSRYIHQFHYTAWPDKSVPAYAGSLADFHKKVLDMSHERKGPLLVHCSAGVGRTGTFIALDYLLDESSETGSVGVLGALERLRQQRVNMVQTKEQYVFLHDVLNEAVECRSSLITAVDFPAKYKQLLSEKSQGKTYLQHDFESIDVTCHEELSFATGKRSANKKKNRYSNILPVDTCRVFLPGTSVDETYINAVYLPGYRDRRAFIATQHPLSSTIIEFWEMVFQENAAVVVMLNEKLDSEEIYWPKDEKMVKYGDITVTMVNSEKSSTYHMFTYEVEKDGEKHTIKQIQVKFWKDSENVPNTVWPMLNLIETVESSACQRSIIVHCRNGADKSGLLCTAMAILDRLKVEQEVAVHQVVKQMKSRRPQIISNLEQFRFCFEIVSAYMETLETYSNFAGHITSD